MPARFLSRRRHQDAVYWGNLSEVGDGSQAFDAPVEIKVRLEDRKELFTDTDGNEVASNAVVYVGQDMVAGEYLFLGDLGDLSSAEEGDPETVDEAHKIRGFRKIPGIKNQYSERKVFL